VCMLPPSLTGVLFILLAVPVARAFERPNTMRKDSQQPMIGPMPMKRFNVDSAGVVSEIQQAPSAESRLDPKVWNNTGPLRMTASQPLVSAEWQGMTPVPETKWVTTTSRTLSPEVGKLGPLVIDNNSTSKIMRIDTHGSASNTTTDVSTYISISTANEPASSDNGRAKLSDGWKYAIVFLVLAITLGMIVVCVSSER